MNWEKYGLRVGAAAVALAIFLQLGGGGFLDSVLKVFATPEAVSLLMYLETGRVIRPSQLQATQPSVTPEESKPSAEEAPTQPEEPEQPEQLPALPVFGPSDTALVEINNSCDYQADLSGWIQKPLSWNLVQSEPTVLILHTHGSESYTKTEDYKETSTYRTLDNRYNMVSIGDTLEKILTAGGISVIHDTTLHDYPSYNSSYANARDAIQAYLKKYPSIKLVLDLHRDAIANSSGQQVHWTVQANGQTSAKLMLVVGTDANGSKHPQWPENMSLAVKLHAQLEKNTPGICRPISFRSQRFNQDLSTGAMLIEVGTAGNTREEALVAVELLGQAILELSRGTGQSSEK